MNSIGRLILGFLLLAVAGCSADPKSEDASASQGPRHIHATHEHPGEDQVDAGPGHEHGEGHSSHHSPRRLTAALLRASDLPAGYIVGGGHHSTTTGGPAPQTAGGCGDLAQLIGTHPAVATPHPHVEATFAKSHFGPEIKQRIIDYGAPQNAQDALAAMAQISTSCPVYEQQRAGPGVDRYRVSPGGPIPGATGGTTVHLEAMGSDFAGIHWDLWVAGSDGRLIAVSLRSARGGSSVDLAPAVTAARAKI